MQRRLGKASTWLGVSSGTFSYSSVMGMGRVIKFLVDNGVAAIGQHLPLHFAYGDTRGTFDLGFSLFQPSSMTMNDATTNNERAYQVHQHLRHHDSRDVLGDGGRRVRRVAAGSAPVPHAGTAHQCPCAHQ